MSQALALQNRAIAESRLGWFERTFPSWALSRAEKRAQLVHLKLSSQYDAAGTGRRTDGYGSAHGDGNSITPRTLSRLQALSHDAVRNDPIADRAMTLIASHTVGTGILATAVAENPAVKKAANELWTAWSTNLNADYDGRNSFTGLEELAMKTIAKSGAVLVHLTAGNASDGLPVPLRARLLEPHHLDHRRDNQITPAGNPIVQGVETDGHGRRVAYYVFPEHPEGRVRRRLESVRVPASEIKHIYDVERPGMMAGIPWMASILPALIDTADYADARRMLAKIASCAVATVTQAGGPGRPLGIPTADAQIQALEPGAFFYLQNGETVDYNTPPVLNDGGFSAEQHRMIASALGLTYADLTGDFTGTSFAAVRAARQQHKTSLVRWRRMLIEHFCNGVFGWVMEFAAEMNGWPEVPTARWTSSPLPSLEPDKEGKAFTADTRSGRVSHSEAWRAEGIQDPEAHAQEIADDQAMLLKKGVVLDSDASRTTGAGILHTDEAGESADTVASATGTETGE